MLRVGLACLFFYMASATICRGKEAALKKCTLTLHWLPQAQFAGCYVAKEKGYYRDAGLDVDIRHKSPQEEICALLRNGKTDFITNFLAPSIKKRDQQCPLVNIGQISQKSALMFVARKGSGIKTIKDMDRKRLGLWMVDFKVIPQILLKKNGANPKIIPVVKDVDLFLWKGVDVITVMWYNEFYQILNAGINEDELTVFFFPDYGLNVPEDGIYCLEKTYSNNPGMCRKLVNATLRGWREAFRDPTGTLKIVKQYCRKGRRRFNFPHQEWMLDKMRELIFPAGCRPGFLSPEIYNSVAGELKKLHDIKRICPYGEFYKNVLDGKTGTKAMDKNVKK